MTSLHALYASTDGSHWDWSQATGAHWNFISNLNPCLDNWQGVICNNDCKYRWRICLSLIKV